MKSILDPTFRYTPSAQTDIRRTFARIRRQQRTAGSGGLERTEPPPRNVAAILPPREVARAKSH